MAEQTAAVANLTERLTILAQATQETEQEWGQQITAQARVVTQRQAQGQTWRRLAQGVARLRQSLAQVQERAQRQMARLQATLADHQERRRTLQQTLAERQAARAAIDTASQCRERDLEKDQIMLDLQVLLASLHDWVREHYLAPEGQRLELETATELLYRKAGRVTWGAEQVEIIFEPYRYAEQQRAMEETCRRCNAAQLRWRDGRLLRFRVASDARFQSCGCQSTGQT